MSNYDLTEFYKSLLEPSYVYGKALPEDWSIYERCSGCGVWMVDATRPLATCDVESCLGWTCHDCRSESDSDYCNEHNEDYDEDFP